MIVPDHRLPPDVRCLRHRDRHHQLQHRAQEVSGQHLPPQRGDRLRHREHQHPVLRRL